MTLIYSQLPFIRHILSRNGITATNRGELMEVDQCSHLADIFQQIGDLLEQGQIFFGNIVNKALENSANLWKDDIWYTLILD